MRRRRRSLTPLLALLLPLALVAGIWLGGHPGTLPGFARSALVGDSDARLVDEALDLLEADYYRPVDRRQLVNRSVDSVISSLQDQFSAYFTPEQYSHFQASTNGQFEGVGLVIDEDPLGLRVVRVFAGSPARRAGLRPGDRITAVDGRALRGQSATEATALIKGRAGTRVRLTVRSRKGEPREVDVERARVEVPVVESAMRRVGGRRLAHVRLSSFTSGAHGEVGQAVRGLLGKGAQGVVLDLRGNGGGLLNEAVLVSSIFIPEGTIVKTRGRSRPERTFEASGGAIDGKVPVTVLVDKGSASASEIVAGAMQDRGRGKVVGQATYGKGVFQEVKQLSNGGALDITVGQYFTPKGRNLGGGGVRKGAGIAPDVRAVDDGKTRRDEALEAAARATVPGT